MEIHEDYILEMPTKLETFRVALKKPRINMAAERFSVTSQNKEHLAVLTTLPKRYSLEMEKENIKHLQKGWRKGSWFEYSIYHKKNKKFIGSINVRPVNPYADTYVIGYWIAQDYAKQGLMTEALSYFADFLERNSKVNKISLEASVQNVASIRLASKCGFVLEGIKYQDEKIGGKFVDNLVFVKLCNKQKMQEAKDKEPGLKALYNIEF